MYFPPIAANLSQIIIHNDTGLMYICLSYMAVLDKAFLAWRSGISLIVILVEQ